MPDTIYGVPLHPLVVHATVVVLPVAALSVLLYAVWPRFRRWSGWGPLALAVLSVILTPMSTSSGESLEEKVGESALLEDHAEMGDLLIYWVVPLAVLAAVLFWWYRTGRNGKAPSWLGIVLSLATAVAAIGTLVMAVLIGHSGAKAAWSDAGAAIGSSIVSSDGQGRA